MLCRDRYLEALCTEVVGNGLHGGRIDFLQRFDGCSPVDYINHDMLRLQLLDDFVPSTQLFGSGIVNGLVLVFPFEETGLQGEVTVKLLQHTDDVIYCQVGIDGLVDEVHSGIDGRVEFEYSLVNLHQCLDDIGSEELCSIAQDRHLGIGTILVTQGAGVVDYIGEGRVHGGFPVAGESDDIGCDMLLLQVAQALFECIVYLQGGRELRRVNGCVEATFAIDTVEGT